MSFFPIRLCVTYLFLVNIFLAASIISYFLCLIQSFSKKLLLEDWIEQFYSLFFYIHLVFLIFCFFLIFLLFSLFIFVSFIFFPLFIFMEREKKMCYNLIRKRESHSKFRDAQNRIYLWQLIWWSEPNADNLNVSPHHIFLTNPIWIIQLCHCP